MAVKTEDKRRRILSAALDCFEKQGFDAARMDDIARRAGVAKGTIYNYFKNKEELLRALAEGFAGVMRPISRTLRGIRTRTSPSRRRS